MLDHIGISVSDYEKAKAFYAKALQPLGYTLGYEITPEMTGGAGAYAGFAENDKFDFWLDSHKKPAPKLHIAFTAKDRKTVDAFYAAAMAAGGRDNGKPGLRPEYHPHYYGAFVLDLDGHNIEVVCHSPES
ncbi:MAG: VOC family protein [Alphaproteobacteria bacterium]|nr:VOC family protein [Alphaproteobacteria bacterium]